MVNDMNEKGFTLVELLATLVILALVVTVGGVAITKTIKSSKDNNYRVLIENIKSAAETYYQECRYMGLDDCPTTADAEGYYSIKLSVLVKYGYLTTNKGNVLADPRDDNNVYTDCTIRYKYHNNRLEVTTLNTNPACPVTDDFKGE